MGTLTLDNNYTTVSHNNKSKNADKKEIKISVIFKNNKLKQDYGYPVYRIECRDTVKDIYLNNLDEVKIEYEKEPEIKMTGESELPFELNEDFHMDISLMSNPDRKYPIDIPKGYKWDGASIPRGLRTIIGENYTPEYAFASLIHDKLCEKHNIIEDNMNLSTAIFCALLKAKGVPEWKADLMSFFVNWYQYLFGRWSTNQIGTLQNSNKLVNKYI